METGEAVIVVKKKMKREKCKMKNTKTPVT